MMSPLLKAISTPVENNKGICKGNEENNKRICILPLLTFPRHLIVSIVSSSSHS